MMRFEQSATVQLPAKPHEIREAINLTIYTLFAIPDPATVHPVTLPTGQIIDVTDPHQFAPETLKIKLRTNDEVCTIWASADTL